MLNGHCSSFVSICLCRGAYLWRKSSWQLSPMSSSFSTVSFICSARDRQRDSSVKKVELRQRRKVLTCTQKPVKKWDAHNGKKETAGFREALSCCAFFLLCLQIRKEQMCRITPGGGAGREPGSFKPLGGQLFIVQF